MMRFIRIAALTFCLAYPILGEETESVRVPLRFETLENAVADGGLIRLLREYKQEKDNPIVFEAEEATIIELQSSDKCIMKDPKTSGGYYLHYVKKLEFDFTVETPGAYQIRLRSWFPLKAGYCHIEFIDDGESRQVFDSQGNDQEVWFWTEGSSYELSKGSHKYVFPSPTAFCAGARLDKVALFPAGKDEVKDFGPAVSSITTPLSGSVITKRISLRLIKSWQLNYEISANGGTAAVEYSFDKTKWMPMPSGKSIDVPLPKPRFIYFRFSLTGKSGEPSPWLQGLELKVRKEGT